MVELAVHHAAARAHALHITGRDAFDIAHAVFVRQFALQNVADDFHVAVAVGAKAGARGDVVFVDDTQIAPAHPLGVVVVGKRERVLAVQPAVVGQASVFAASDVDHCLLLWVAMGLLWI